MPGLSGRMSTVVKAKISHLLDRAEDPAETLDYSYEKQLEQLQNVKRGIADIVTAKKRLQLQETSVTSRSPSSTTRRARRWRRAVRTWRGRRLNASIWPRARCSHSTSRWRSLRTSSRS